MKSSLLVALLALVAYLPVRAQNLIIKDVFTADPAPLGYFFYHNGARPDGGNFRRSVCVDEMHYNFDGTIKPIVQTTQGVSPVK